MSKLNGNSTITPVRQAANELGAQLKRRGAEIVPQSMTKNMVSMEGLSEAEFQNHQVSAQTLSKEISRVFKDTIGKDNANYQLSQEQLEAATITASAYGDPQTYFRTAQQVSLEGIDMPAGSSSVGTFGYRLPSDRFVSLEAFDNMELQKGIDVSVVFNALAIGQSPFNDDWFPVVVGTPDEVVFRINIPRILVQNEYIAPDQSGDPADFKKHNLIRAALDYTILMNNSTDLVPIVRAGVNEDKFVPAAAVAPHKAKVGAVEVTTAPLKIGVAHSLINLSSNEQLKLAGAIGETDAVEPKVSIRNLYIAVDKAAAGSDPAVSSVLKFATMNLPGAGYIRPMEGNLRSMILNFNPNSLNVKPTMKDVAGAAPAALAAVTAGNYTLVLGASLAGNLNLETSNEKVIGGDVDVVKVLDEDGKEVSLDDAGVQAALEGLTFAVIGYDIDARRTNSNLRTKGLILNPDMETRAYYVPLNAPLVSQTPIGQENMGLDLNALVQGVHMQIENAAVTTLLDFDKTLADWFVSSEQINLYPSFETPGELLVAPFYEAIPVDIQAELNSTSSAKKVDDIQGVLVSTIREVIARACRETGYEVSLRANNGGSVEQLRVIAVTDPVLPKYLVINGDDRYLGANASLSVTSVNDLRMRDTIFLSFGRKGTGKHDPLTFGNMLYIPELAISAQVNRNGATIMERQVQPRFRHIVNLPILIKLTVTNLVGASRSAALYNTKAVTP